MTDPLRSIRIVWKIIPSCPCRDQAAVSHRLPSPYGTIGITVENGVLTGLRFLPTNHNQPCDPADWKQRIVEYVPNQCARVEGTRFQISVWRELVGIPSGLTRSYQQIAEAVGKPRAVRAVGGAVGKNPLAILIPCHRVIRKDGSPGGYHWGVPVKQALLGDEQQQGIYRPS